MQGNEKWAEIKDSAPLSGKTLTTTLKANTVTTYLIETGAKVTSFETYKHRFEILKHTERNIERI